MMYNTTTFQYTYNNLNQLSTRWENGIIGSYFEYDNNGNLSDEGLNMDWDEHHLLFTYDRENRMTQVVKDGLTIDYTYCSLGKRVMKAYNNNTTVYFMDGINTIMEKYGSNLSNFSTSAAYTLAPGVVGHIISERENSTDLYFHYDPIGNVMFITDCYGNITVSYVQEGFGNILASSGGLTTNNYHLTTKEIEPETGLYFFYARWYDPVVGRFITKDPEEENSIYIYVGDNPISNFDPDGRKVICFPWVWDGWPSEEEGKGYSTIAVFKENTKNPDYNICICFTLHKRWKITKYTRWCFDTCTPELWWEEHRTDKKPMKDKCRRRGTIVGLKDYNACTGYCITNFPTPE
jgi:RHS repeat-associated protein